MTGKHRKMPQFCDKTGCHAPPYELVRPVGKWLCWRHSEMEMLKFIEKKK